MADTDQGGHWAGGGHGAMLLGERYRLEERIGRGGTADVHRAFDLRLQRPVAVKLLRDAGSDSRRFVGEIRAMASFAHPHVVSVLDAGELDGRPYLVMALVDGTTLAARLERGPLPSGDAARLGEQVASALAYAHERQVVHRDVKPANVLLDTSGWARLADFGIARFADASTKTATGLTLGTPAYLAPEQVEGAEVGPPADVYALGLVLLESLTARKAFDGPPLEAAAARLLNAPAIPDVLGARWTALVGRMTARRPEDRPSAAEVATVLGAGSDRRACGPSPAPPVLPEVRSGLLDDLTWAGSSALAASAESLAGASASTSPDLLQHATTQAFGSGRSASAATARDGWTESFAAPGAALEPGASRGRRTRRLVAAGVVVLLAVAASLVVPSLLTSSPSARSKGRSGSATRRTPTQPADAASSKVAPPTSSTTTTAPASSTSTTAPPTTSTSAPAPGATGPSSTSGATPPGSGSGSISGATGSTGVTGPGGTTGTTGPLGGTASNGPGAGPFGASGTTGSDPQVPGTPGSQYGSGQGPGGFGPPGHGGAHLQRLD